MKWYEVNNVEGIDSPALLIYPDRIKKNIQIMLSMVENNPKRLRPHVKTYKMAEVVELQMEAGINQFKCATIAEAEMLGEAGARDVLLAYQPVGPKIDRLFHLITNYPGTMYSTLIDNINTARTLSQKGNNQGFVLDVYIDIDSGNHRTGIDCDKAYNLHKECQSLPGIRICGLHAYDGHLRQTDIKERKLACDEGFKPVAELRQKILNDFDQELIIVAGGSPAFPCHAPRGDEVVCSPGTCLLWDWGYHAILPESQFEFAALVLTRVISKVGKDRITLDLGHKSIASENPFPRVHFLNLEVGEQISHSEEHLVLHVGDNSAFQIGDTFYGVPIHICPTCALYNEAHVVQDGHWHESWNIIARTRKITV